MEKPWDKETHYIEHLPSLRSIGYRLVIMLYVILLRDPTGIVMAAGQGKRLVILLDQNIQLFYLKIQKKPWVGNFSLGTLAWEL